MTIRINLLPRPAAHLVRQTRRFQLMLVAVIGGGLAILFALSAAIERQHHTQQQLLHLLQTEHTNLDRLIRDSRQLEEKISALRQRQRDLESLRQQRNDAVRLLAWLTQTVPHGVSLHALAQDGNRVALNGIAASHRHIVALMDNLRAPASMFTHTELHEIRATDSATAGPDQHFAITAQYSPTTSRITEYKADGS